MTIPKAQQARGFFRATPQRMPSQRRLGQPLKAKAAPKAISDSRQSFWARAMMDLIKHPPVFVNDSHPIHHVPAHTSRVFNPRELRNMVERIGEVCKQENIEALLCCGHSGLLVAGAVSCLFSIPVFAARKPDDQPVAGRQGLRVNGIAMYGPVRRWAWLDDHISSGRTFDRSRKLAKEARLIATAIPVAFLLYEGEGRYLMTEEQYIGYLSGWGSPEPVTGEVEVRAIRI